MKEYSEAKATFITLDTKDVITSSIQDRGVLSGFGNDGVYSVGIDEIM